MLSIVVPALNAASRLERTLPVLVKGDVEVVVADGGSTDGTSEAAERLGARVVRAPRGRGSQLAAGGAATGGDWLLFLHADTLPGAGWREETSRFMADPGNGRRAAVFRFALDDQGPAARRMEKLVNWRTRFLGLPYGDQGLLLGRDFYRELGGFKAIPLMEDVDMVRRIGKKRLRVLDTAAETSAERFRQEGYVMRPLRNLACLGLYFLGAPPAAIARLY